MYSVFYMRTRLLIKVSTVCLHNFLFRFEQKLEQNRIHFHFQNRRVKSKRV